ncbi:MAG: hypothetical protein Q9217_002271 [Psora testacea]
MVIQTPKPYGPSDNSPLDASGANFPCKATSNANGPINEMAIGATQQLTFLGSAVHGGGSCQISLTKDNPATKSSKWMVIHSIMGGCPARSTEGNLVGGKDLSDPFKYEYKIPEGIAPGTYTLAWTWYNRVGNREMYMNCANVKVSGGSSKRDTYQNETYAIPELTERDTSFPDMFIANIPVSDCRTPEGKDVKFPDPGKSVEMAGDAASLAPATGPKCGAGPGGLPSSDASGGGQGAGAQAPAGGAGAGASGQGSGTSGSGADGQAPPGSSGAGASDQSTGSGQGSGTSSPAGPAVSSVPSGASNSSGSSSSGSSGPPTGATSTSCTTAGQTICSPDGKQIGTCDQTMKVVMQPVPASTVCKGGLIQVIQKFRA